MLFFVSDLTSQKHIALYKELSIYVQVCCARHLYHWLDTVQSLLITLKQVC